MASETFKGMTDERLQASIESLRSLLYVGAEVKQRGGGMARMLRDLDIAVAVKRQRIRAGTWTLAR